MDMCLMPRIEACKVFVGEKLQRTTVMVTPALMPFKRSLPAFLPQGALNEHVDAHSVQGPTQVRTSLLCRHVSMSWSRAACSRRHQSFKFAR
jgi:hypothetical protein